MLSYELSKELKNAGFPKVGPDLKLADGDVIYWYPTLSELIEACGEMTLLIGKDKTVALNAINPMESNIRAEGTTPDIAVARLWLALKSA